jgi:hypothetical protein
MPHEEPEAPNHQIQTFAHDPLAAVSASQMIPPAAALQAADNEVEDRWEAMQLRKLNPGHVHFWLAPTPDPRAWSAGVDVTETCSIFTIRAFLGDPDASLPSSMKALNKSQLRGIMQRSGFDDISGTKDALLYRIQTGVPFVEYRIDGRECLQRMLVVCLHAWGWDAGHCFRATMPARGECPWGAKRLGDLRCLHMCHPEIDMGSFSHRWRPEPQRIYFLDAWSGRWVWDYAERPETWIKSILSHSGPASGACRNPNPAVDRATLEALIARRLTLDDPAPFRTVGGIGFEPGAVGRAFEDFDDDVGGALSLEECELASCDRISMLYDFGARNTIVFKVVRVDRDQALLPEMPFIDREYPILTRAHIGQTGGARARSRRQYDVSSSDSDANGLDEE